MPLYGCPRSGTAPMLCGLTRTLRASACCDLIRLLLTVRKITEERKDSSKNDEMFALAVPVV